MFKKQKKSVLEPSHPHNVVQIEIATTIVDLVLNRSKQARKTDYKRPQDVNRQGIDSTKSLTLSEVQGKPPAEEPLLRRVHTEKTRLLMLQGRNKKESLEMSGEHGRRMVKSVNPRMDRSSVVQHTKFPREVDPCTMTKTKNVDTKGLHEWDTNPKNDCQHDGKIGKNSARFGADGCRYKQLHRRSYRYLGYPSRGRNH
ncbi:hypothetical protein ACH5RR_018366 [Cinchona calisaya]|uniref:Uncharacterized protein n=1 Tax=Cinchona calisaya TaxID=153742 RepID=A0ABD2ZPX8_9GENT